uniref:Pentacotripeptide-repeat region of PRORP domain-containing protein n=1 Tax=Salix viminalis TaxID=40686 RepID=A0A6N2KZ11_SALVM
MELSSVKFKATLQAPSTGLSKNTPKTKERDVVSFPPSPAAHSPPPLLLPPTTTSDAASGTAKSLSYLIYKESNHKKLVKKFKNASVNEHFRTKVAIYKETIRRLSASRKFDYVEEIIEDQKQYKDMSKEGFNARLISLYGSAGISKKFDEVEGLFRGLSEEIKIEPDLISYNTVMKAFCEMGSLDSAVSLLNEIKRKGLEPDLITFNTLLHGFYANGRFVDGERIWDLMKERNVEPNIRSYSAKLFGMASEKRMNDVVKVVEEMNSKGIKHDPFSYHALIRGFVNEDDFEKAKHWHGEMWKTGCKPHRLVFETLIPFAVEKGDLAFAFKLCKDVIHSKLVVQEALIQKCGGCVG